VHRDLSFPASVNVAKEIGVRRLRLETDNTCLFMVRWWMKERIYAVRL
jgi:hypothetical protein